MDSLVYLEMNLVTRRDQEKYDCDKQNPLYTCKTDPIDQNGDGAEIHSVAYNASLLHTRANLPKEDGVCARNKA